MSQVGQLQDTWPGGLTYVFQGTVAEDATAGTHVCTLTVTPGAGNEIQVLYGQILIGNTATAQIPLVKITDGTNTLSTLLNPSGASITSANQIVPFPQPGAITAASIDLAAVGQANLIVSGTMTLVLQLSTAAVSVTQTFAVVCRIHGAKPTAVLNDTIGTSTNTVNTDAVF